MPDLQSPSVITIPAAARLDRLSDRLGSLFPGGSRLPPRHPLKVSLVMGLLGIMTGWGTFGLLFLSEYLGSLLNGIPAWDHWWLWPVIVPIPAFAVSGLLLILPLAFWSRRGRIAAACSLPFTILSHYAFLIILWFGDDEIFVANIEWNGIIVTILACLPVALAHAIAAVLVTGRRVLSVLAFATVISSLCGSMALFLYEHAGATFPLDDFDIFFYSVPFTAFYGSLAICLGVSLWDATPRPKFEPVEST